MPCGHSTVRKPSTSVFTDQRECLVKSGKGTLSTPANDEVRGVSAHELSHGLPQLGERREQACRKESGECLSISLFLEFASEVRSMHWLKHMFKEELLD